MENGLEVRQEEEQSGSAYLTGFFGALLGALLCAGLLLLVGALTGMYSGWFGFLGALASAKGYQLLHGARKKGYAVAVVWTCTIILTFLAVWVGAAMSLMGEARVVQMAQRAGVGTFTMASWMLLNNLGMLALSYVLPAVATLLGLLLAKRTLTMYAEPGALHRAVQAAQQTVERDGGQAQFYFFDVKRLRGLRATVMLLLLPMLVGLFGVLFVFIAFEELTNGMDIGLTVALLVDLILSMIYMIVLLFYITPLTGAGAWCFARDNEGTLYRVNLRVLNQIAAYQFGTYLGFGVLKYDKMSADEQALLRSSILRAVEDYRNGRYFPGGAVTMALVPLTGLVVQKEKRWGWKCVYRGANGSPKTMRIARAYTGGLHPTGQLAPGAPDEPTRVQPAALLVGLIPVLLAGAAFVLSLLF